jgi:LacI family transcriptional regulator
MAVRHLIELGHRRIAIVTNAPLSYTAARDRLAGYRLALRDAGIESDERLVAEADFNAASGRTAMAGLLEANGLTAAFVASDVVALGAMAAIREAGRRVPDDVSVVGFDDVPPAAWPAYDLTSFRQRVNRMVAETVTTLIEHIEGGATEPRRIAIDGVLIERGSTRKPETSRT